MESGPVFADSSGRRRRAMRYAGVGFAVAMAVCLGSVVVAMTGGPQAPFTHWAVQRPAQAAPTHKATEQAAGRASAGGRSGGAQAPIPGAPGQGSSSQGATPSAGASPSSSASPTAGASATASPGTSGSPTPTNRGGKSPPGQARTATRSPNPHKSTSVA